MARKGTGMWRLLRGLSGLLALLVAIPLVLTPLYLVLDPVSVPMVERYVTGRPVLREWRPIAEISDRLKAAVILSEDGQFCSHPGVDFGALREEVERYMEGEDARGASTITMQVARNLFLWNRQSVVRKALEVPLALYIDLVLPKRRIMEIYLNVAEWGPSGQFGVATGADAAFGIVPQNLDWRTATLLVTALPKPHAAPARHALCGHAEDRRHHRRAGQGIRKPRCLRGGGRAAGAVKSPACLPYPLAGKVPRRGG